MSDSPSTETVIACWKDWAGESEEHLELQLHDAAIVAKSTIQQKQCVINYQIHCDVSWHVQSVQIECFETKQTLKFVSDGNGNWSDLDGLRPEFTDAIDIDITATPFTNSLPIRRLKLALHESTRIKILYIETPDLKLSLDEQRYTRIGQRSYRFEQIATGFSRELEVDEHGLVLDYPDLFRRIVSG